MSKFSRAKQQQPSTEPEGLADFAAGASVRTLKPVETTNPWEAFDPKAKPTKGLTLRLNDYELALVQHVAAMEDRSAQKTIKRILISALETSAKEAWG